MCVRAVYDVCFLHSHEMYAVAQRECVYLYDSNGLELHQLKQHNHARAARLPAVSLFAHVHRRGRLVEVSRHVDGSTLVSQHRTALGRCRCAHTQPTERHCTVRSLTTAQ